MVCRFHEPEGTWTLLEAVKLAERIRLGVVVVSTQTLKGRIGFFCNEIISGACLDSTGEVGILALKKLLEQPKGMFAFRACLGNDAAELGQSLAIQIDELLSRKTADPSLSPGAALAKFRSIESHDSTPYDMAPDGTNGGTNGGGQGGGEDGDAADPNQSAPPVLAVPPNLGDVEFITQSGTFSAYGFEKQVKEGQSKFNKLLSMSDGTKKSNEPQAVPEEDNDVDAYNKLLEKQRKKVENDLRALQANAATTGTVSGGRTEELEMLADFLQYEQQRVTGSWQRDEIDEQKLLHPQARSERGNDSTRGEPAAAGVKNSAHSPHSPQQQRPAAVPRWLLFGLPAALGLAGIFLMFSIHTQSTVDKLIASGEQNLKNNKNDQALIDFNTAVSLASETPRAHYYRAMAYTRLGKYDEADADFVSAQKFGMAPEVLALARAGAQCKKGDFDSAIDTINYLLERQPNNARAYILRGTCEEHLGAVDESIDDLTKGISLAKDKDVEARGLLERATALAHNHKRADALKDLDRSIALEPAEAALIMHANLSKESKNPQAAVDDYTKLLARDEKSIRTLIARGIALSSLNKDAEAVQDFSRAIELDKTALEAYIQRGTVLLRDGQYKAAADDLRTSLKLSPGLPEVREKLGAANSHLKPEERS